MQVDAGWCCSCVLASYDVRIFRADSRIPVLLYIDATALGNSAGITGIMTDFSAVLVLFCLVDFEAGYIQQHRLWIVSDAQGNTIYLDLKIKHIRGQYNS